jgi:hypothetical protein
VHLPSATLTPAEYTACLDLLDSDVPVTILVEIDDVQPATPGMDRGHGRARQLARIALGLEQVFVVQAPASHLVQMRDRIADAVAADGPALVSVFTGETPSMTGLCPYVTAALALEARVFPAFTRNPTEGDQLDLSFNPQRDADWPTYTLDVEADAHARASIDVTITAADLLACDGMHRRHFAVVPRDQWTDELIPLSRWLSSAAAERKTTTPYLWLADDGHRLHRVVVDAAIARETEAMLDHWRHLRRLAAPTEVPAADAVNASAPMPVEATPAAAASDESVPATAESSRPAGDPYIETPRCSSCNECIQLNGRMFKYDANKQAYIADPDAGTFRELVEAAESCQVSIIHPGQPRRPDEPGLDELVQRAAAFQ